MDNIFIVLTFSIFCQKCRARDVAARYDYTVEFTGLGAPPPGKDVGFCTQIGVFVRKYLKNGEHETLEKHNEHVYKTVSHFLHNTGINSIENNCYKKLKHLGLCVVNVKKPYSRPATQA